MKMMKLDFLKVLGILSIGFPKFQTRAGDFGNDDEDKLKPT